MGLESALMSGMTDQITNERIGQPIPFDNTYARLPEPFYARIPPTPVKNPELIRLNEPLAADMGLDISWLRSPAGVAMLAGAHVPPGAEPLAAAYAGHQFGNFVPQLGDGRAILLGEVVGPDGTRRDIQLKGSGPTPFSRGGDGRAALGPVLREYIVSEAFAALGIPTTRALAAARTGEYVFRDAAIPGAVLTRVASSHVRVGTFQYFAARGDTPAIKTLADYVIDRHYPDAREEPQPYLALFKAVMKRQASLVAQWLHVGFIHGVMNTDNMSIAGETIDFGPCAFLDSYDPAKVFSSIDRQGRYAYANQPRIAQWNLARLAETLLPLLSDDQETAVGLAQDALDGFKSQFDASYLDGARAKLGLTSTETADRTLFDDLLTAMSATGADYTNTFRALTETADAGSAETIEPMPPAFTQWLTHWRARFERDSAAPPERVQLMRRANPSIIPRNHRIEEAITAAVIDGDFSFFHALTDALATPDRVRPQHNHLIQPPAESEKVTQTFCGT